MELLFMGVLLALNPITWMIVAAVLAAGFAARDKISRPMSS